MVFANAETKRLLLDIVTRKLTFPTNGKNTLLLYGTYGSGKTTFANVFFNDYEKAHGGNEALIDVITNEEGDKVTEQIARLNSIADLVSFNQSEKHYFLFDEADNYSELQQQRLKSFLNRKNIVVVMTTNFLHKIDKGIQSRSHLVSFNASNNAFDYVERMKVIISRNAMPMVSDATLTSIAQAANGDWRTMCAELEQVCSHLTKPPKPNIGSLTLVR
jgi:replication-associated recombination protein RarA